MQLTLGKCDLATLPLSLNDSVPTRDESLLLSAIGSPDYQMRREFDEERLQELAQTMDILGQLQRVGVRPNRRGDGYTLIYGERRLRAARLLGWTHIDARVFEIGEGPATLVVHATENLQRVDPGLFEYLDVVMRLRDTGMGEEVVARVLGRSRGWVSSVLDIARDPTGRAMAEAGLLSNALAWPRFMDLPEQSRKRLLDTGEPITTTMCRLEEQRLARVAERAQMPMPLGPTGTDAPPEQSPDPVEQAVTDPQWPWPGEPTSQAAAQVAPSLPEGGESVARVATPSACASGDDDWDAARRAFCAGVCEALRVVADHAPVTVWKKIVRAAGEAELLQYASRIEPDEWERSGFAKFVGGDFQRSGFRKAHRRA